MMENDLVETAYLSGGMGVEAYFSSTFMQSITFIISLESILRSSVLSHYAV